MSSLSVTQPLRRAAFRGLLAGGLIYFVGSFMQAMATAWLIVELDGSAFLAALVQTASFGPMFLLALPAGVLADTTDRRRLLLVVLAVQAGVVLVLAALLALGWAGAGTLLALTFVCGCCTALLSPGWNSAVVDTLPREELPQAITLIGISYNAARAIGPALAGALYALASPVAVFLGASLGVLALWQAVRWHPPRPHPPSRLPAERLWGGVLSALRFARHSDAVLAQLVRTGAFGAAGAALWALLPVIGQRQLGLGATGFGLLMACLGGGAVLAGLFIGRWRQRLGLERLVGTGTLLFAMVMLVAAWSRWSAPVYAALFVGGGCWMGVMSTYNMATQASAPRWVRARANALHVLCSLGSFAVGSAVSGALASLLGLSWALTLAALALAAGLLLVRRFPLRMSELEEVTQAPLSEDLFVAHRPDPEAGPVSVEFVYRVQSDRAEAFLDAVTQLRGPRRRDGATLWRVYRDLADPSRFVERFIVTSWADYLHQRARATLADLELEASLLEYLVERRSPTVQHFIAER
ncbi:MAG: MFS transporter [Rubrivivax sp.]|nr:MFS transporter [Rubrivivax sp.]